MRSAVHCLALVASLASAAQAFAQGYVESRTVELAGLPPGAFNFVTLIHEQKQEFVLHLLPTSPQERDYLLDVTSGRPVTIDAPVLADSYVIARRVSAADVRGGGHVQAQWMARQGCAGEGVSCTLASEAQQVLVLQPIHGTRRSATLVDLRRLHRVMALGLAGALSEPFSRFSDADIEALQMLLSIPQNKLVWQAALRSIEGPTAWQNMALMVAQTGLASGAISDAAARAGFDLRSAIEEAKFRSLLIPALDAWERTRDAKIGEALADLVLESGKEQFQVRLQLRLLEWMLERPEPTVRELSQIVARRGRRTGDAALVCFAQWMRVAPCVTSSPAQAVIDADAPAVDPAGHQAARPNATQPAARATASAPRMVIPGVAGISLASIEALKGSDAPAQELGLIKRLANHLVLIAFNARQQDQSAAQLASSNGYSFTARALGTLTDGRFEIRATRNARSPVPLETGRYLVRVSVSLDYTREDKCESGVLCMFKEPRSYSKSQSREVAFQLNPSNQFSASQRIDFNNLMSASEVESKYVSRIQDIRLSIVRASFEGN